MHPGRRAAPKAGCLLADRFEVGGPLGEGGFGYVRAAYDRKLRVECAIKGTFMVRDEARLRREFEIASVIVNTELLNTARDFYRDPLFGLFLVLPLIGNGVQSLAERLNSASSGLPEPEVFRIGTHLLHALLKLKEHGISHCDLTPRNILVGNDGRLVRIIDFGNARRMGARDPSWKKVTDDGSLVCTPGFVSPEYIKGEPLTETSDLYSVGLVLMQALLGHQIVLGASDLQTVSVHLEQGPLALPKAIRASVFSGLEAWVSKRADDRPPIEVAIAQFEGWFRTSTAGRPTIAFRPRAKESVVVRILTAILGRTSLGG